MLRKLGLIDLGVHNFTKEDCERTTQAVADRVLEIQEVLKRFE